MAPNKRQDGEYVKLILERNDAVQFFILHAVYLLIIALAFCLNSPLCSTVFATFRIFQIFKPSKMQRALTSFSRNMATMSQIRMAGERGSGAGQGGGSGGSIRDAGGSFGKMEAAHEDQYFYNVQKDQLKKLKEDLHDEISFHEEQIKRHQEAINRHKERITNMDRKE